MTAQHTPGPWAVIGTTVTAKYSLQDTIDIADCERCAVIPIDEQFANARLIAAAPDLLEALKSLMPHIEAEVEQRQTSGSAEYSEALEMLSVQARAAIAKARGKQ